MILESVENGPLIWPTIEENGVTRPKKYSELSATEAIQADCDVKATNIILQGLPPEVYALVSNHRIAKELWERIQLLMQGTSLKNNRERVVDDPIVCLNHYDVFLDAVFTSLYPISIIKLRNSLKYPMQKATINGWKSDLQQVRGDETSFAAGVSKDIYTPGANALILSVIKQIKTQVVNCTKINLDNKSVNDTLTAELERYKEQVKVLKEGQNIDLKSNDNVLDTSAQCVEIDSLKQTLSEHLKEKESLMQTVSLLKNDFKKEESRNIDRDIALEKRIKLLDNIVFKRDQSAQTVHMLMKPQFFYDHTTKQALGF
ncbi:hypothetical protein Tco_1265178 [Tanacetum coccineum]